MKALFVAASLGLLIVSGQGLAQEVPKPKEQSSEAQKRDNRKFIKDLNSYLDGLKDFPDTRRRQVIEAAREIILPQPWLGKDKEDHFPSHLQVLNLQLKGMLSHNSLITKEEFESVLLVEFKYLLEQYCKLPPLDPEARTAADSVIEHFELGLKLAIPKILPHDDQQLQESILKHTKLRWNQTRSEIGNYFVLETLYPVPDTQWPDPEKTFVDAAMLQQEETPPSGTSASVTPSVSSPPTNRPDSKIDRYSVIQAAAFYEISRDPMQTCFQTRDQVINNNGLMPQSEEFIAAKDELYQSFRTRLQEKNVQILDDFQKRVKARQVQLQRRVQGP